MAVTLAPPPAVPSKQASFSSLSDEGAGISSGASEIQLPLDEQQRQKAAQHRCGHGKCSIL